tara:strand:- start:3 stop:311 length:309 start_codon:yes stop_codon:yes gene_type:complete
MKKYKITISTSRRADSLEEMQRVAEWEMIERNVFNNDCSKVEDIGLLLKGVYKKDLYKMYFSYILNASDVNNAWAFADMDARARAEAYDDNADVFEVEEVIA